MGREEERGGESATTMNGASTTSDNTGSADAAAATAVAATTELNAEPELETLHSTPFDCVATKKVHGAKPRANEERRG